MPGRSRHPVVCRLRAARGAAGPFQSDAHPSALGGQAVGRVVARTVQSCVVAGIARGDVVHIDATLIRADVSWESLAVRHADVVLAENDDEQLHHGRDGDCQTPGRRDGKQTRPTQPDLPDRSRRDHGHQTRAEQPARACLQAAGAPHEDDVCGVVLDVQVTTGEVNEGDHILPQLDAVAAATGTRISPPRPTKATPMPKSMAGWSGAASTR